MWNLSNLGMRTLALSLTGVCATLAVVSGTHASADKASAHPTPKKKENNTQGEVTFNKDIAPIVFSRCSSCHRPDQAAPFSLLTYHDVEKRGSLIAEVTKSHLMPPWKPGQSDCAFRDENRLTEGQIDLIQHWVSSGMKEGTTADLPALPKFTEGWTLGKPDLVVKMPAAFPVPADGPDIYRNFVLPLHLPQDVYVSAIEFRPSSRTVVHHSLFFYDATGAAKKREGEDGKPGFDGAMGGILGGNRSGLGALQRLRGGTNSGAIPPLGTLGGWAVGAQPVAMPEGLAYAVPKDADLILSTHFHPSGKAEQEQSVVGIYFAKQPPEKQFTTIQLPPVFGALSGLNIPAGAKDYSIEDSFTLPVDVKAFGVTAHAHYLGKSMKLTATLPDGTMKTLLWIPDWDFNWQGQYMFQDFVSLPKGTVLHGVVRYDNSADNPHQPSNPPKLVKWGEQSTDEMGSVILRLVATNEADLPELQKTYRLHLRDEYLKHPFFPRQQASGANR
jgi:mono/diheme cytochrome c family protein